MSDIAPKITEEEQLQMLKDKAKVLGITYHPSIGIEALRKKINDALPPEEEKTDSSPVVESQAKRNMRMRNEARRLVRIRLTCMDPSKKEWPGKIYTVSNSVIGTVKKFVPFQGHEDGYHVPHVIYEQLKAERHQRFRKVKMKNGIDRMEGYLAKTYAIEVLDPLSKDQLKDLADRQAAAHSIE